MSAHERERLAAWIDGELPPREKAIVEAHLSECTECAALLADMEAVDDLARNLSVEAPAGYFETFPARVRERIVDARGRRRRWRTPVWTWAAAAVFLLAVVTPLTLSRLHEVTSAPAPRGADEWAEDAFLPLEGEVPEAVAAKPPEAGVASSAEVRDAPAASPGLEPKKEMRQEPFQEEMMGGVVASPEARVSIPPAKARAPEPPPALARGWTVAPAAPAPEGALDEENPGRSAVPESAPRPTAAKAPPAVAQEVASFAAAPPSDEEAAAGERPRAAGELLRSGPPDEATRHDPARLEEEIAEDDERRPHRPGRVSGEQKTSGLARLEERQGSEESLAELRRLYGERPTDAAGWREHRESWRAFVAAYPESPWADEARMRTVEAGIEAWEAGGDPVDRARALDDARAYLARDDALLKAPVRDLLEQVDGR